MGCAAWRAVDRPLLILRLVPMMLFEPKVRPLSVEAAWSPVHDYGPRRMLRVVRIRSPLFSSPCPASRGEV